MQMRKLPNDPNGDWPPIPYNNPTPCMHCDTTTGHWERVWTGDTDSRDGFEDWFCCHDCRDAGRPCDTFHMIEPRR